MAKKQPDKLTKVQIINEIRTKAQRNFSCFGGGRGGGGFNPVADALADKQPMFAMGVDVFDVIEFVIDEYESMKQ